MTTLTQIQLRRDTLANWLTADPVLATGEVGCETDTGRFKVGDGASMYSQIPYQSQLVPTGTRASPHLITAAGGIGNIGTLREYQFVKGNGGPVTVTATPQIVAGLVIGQELKLQGRDDTATVTLADGNGLDLNGPCVLRAGSTLSLVWDGTVWAEDDRNDL